MAFHTHFEITGPRAYCRITGAGSVAERNAAVEDAIRRARGANAGALVVNVAELDVTAPSLGERYESVFRWAALAGEMRVAKVTTADASSRALQARVAEQFGLQVGVFASELDAIAWLDLGTLMPC